MLDHENGGRRRVDGMAAVAAEPTAKGAKKDKEDPLVQRRNELVLLDANARAEGERRGKELVREAKLEAKRLKQEAKLEAKRLKREAKLEAKRIKREAKLEAKRLKREAKLRAKRLKQEAKVAAHRLKREAKGTFAEDLRSVCKDLKAANRSWGACFPGFGRRSSTRTCTKTACSPSP